jgi:hypothetical protein
MFDGDAFDPVAPTLNDASNLELVNVDTMVLIITAAMQLRYFPALYRDRRRAELQVGVPDANSNMKSWGSSKLPPTRRPMVRPLAGRT